jgi:hypothetical protein
MGLYPEVQVKIRSELSEVVGPDRLPSLEDRDRLPSKRRCAGIQPYLLVLRAKQPKKIITGVRSHVYLKNAHMTMSAAGYYIPKGTIVLPNVW